jgi:uncharacterized protein
MDLSYVVTPFAAWLFAGSCKFLVNSILAKQAAFGLIGYGGFPSNHTAIVTSVAWLIAFKEGVASPALGVALALAFIVVLDATSLRIKVGQHAQRLNRLATEEKPLRERIGHTPVEVFGGIIAGLITALCVAHAGSWLPLG